MKFYETSAINGNNVDKIFYNTTEIILINGDNNYYDLTNDNCRITFTSRGAVVKVKKNFTNFFDNKIKYFDVNIYFYNIL